MKKPIVLSNNDGSNKIHLGLLRFKEDKDVLTIYMVIDSPMPVDHVEGAIVDIFKSIILDCIRSSKTYLGLKRKLKKALRI